MIHVHKFFFLCIFKYIFCTQFIDLWSDPISKQDFFIYFLAWFLYNKFFTCDFFFHTWLYKIRLIFNTWFLHFHIRYFLHNFIFTCSFFTIVGCIFIFFTWSFFTSRDIVFTWILRLSRVEMQFHTSHVITYCITRITNNISITRSPSHTKLN